MNDIMERKKKKKLILAQMHAYLNCFKMDNQMEIGQTHFGPSQNKNRDQNNQMVNPKGALFL